jgi:hypothetical protein
VPLIPLLAINLVLEVMESLEQPRRAKHRTGAPASLGNALLPPKPKRSGRAFSPNDSEQVRSRYLVLDDARKQM